MNALNRNNIDHDLYQQLIYYPLLSTIKTEKAFYHQHVLHFLNLRAILSTITTSNIKMGNSIKQKENAT